MKKHICKFCEEDFFTHQALGGHIRWCKKGPLRAKTFKSEGYKSSLANLRQGFEKHVSQKHPCRFCRLEFKGRCGVSTHERYCEDNPAVLKETTVT